MDTKIRAQKLDPEEENSPAAPAGTQTRDLLITNLALKFQSCPNYPQSNSVITMSTKRNPKPVWHK